MMNLEGRLLGNRYQMIEKIGNGGMATVYKAKCLVLNRYVAVKVLRDEFTTDDEFIRRFNTEAQAAASLTHPNIVSVFDVGHEGNLYYIVMELIKGKTLKEIIVENGATAWKWSINVAMQIASALETAHKNNIIHRDIKPHNIIITEDGIAKVTDFGIAKAVSNSTITAFGTTIGSVHYFSPEHARGGFTDAKSDLYSLGVVMYEMLTGKVPFDADTPVSVALMHMQDKPVEPIKVNPSIPVAVNKIVIKAMEKDPNMRYQSATEMLKDLSMALKHPDGDFVSMNTMQHDFPTQTIQTVYDKTMQDRIKEKDENMKRHKKKENKFVSFMKKHKILSTFVGIVILFSLSLGGTYFALTNGKVLDVQIPNVVGKTSEEAKMIIEEAKLVYDVKSEEYDETVEAGKIISQDPSYKENYSVKENSIINVVISKGQKIIVVPKVTGKEITEAETELTELGLKVEIVEEESKKVEEGYVIKQDILANTEVSLGSKVTLTVSKGVEMCTVPNLIGKTEEEAKNEIASAGLKINSIVNEEDTTKANGVILKQTLDVGSSVEKGSGITITVNKIVEKKNATIYVNLKSLTGGYSVTDNTIKEENKKVELEVKAGGETIYKEKVDKNSTNINTGTNKVIGKGIIEVKVFVNGVRKAEKDIDLNTITTYTFE